MRPILALDFGGTKLAAGLIDDVNGVVVDRRRTDTPPTEGARRSIEQMLGMARSLIASCENLVVGVGVSFGGPVYADRRRVVTSHHVSGWDDLPLADVVSEALGLPVMMDNDANAQTLGEWRYGAGQDTRSFVFVNVGTGIGGGIVLDGRLVRGAHGMAGEIGHTVVDTAGPVCTCGKRGCVESFAAGPYVAAAARERLDAGDKGSMLATIPRGAITGRDVYAAAAACDPLALSVIRRAGEALGIGIANICVLVDPELVAIGGGVTRSGGVFFDPLLAAVRANAAPLDPASLRVAPGMLGDDSNLLGAACLLTPDSR